MNFSEQPELMDSFHGQQLMIVFNVFGKVGGKSGTFSEVIVVSSVCALEPGGQLAPAAVWLEKDRGVDGRLCCPS